MDETKLLALQGELKTYFDKAALEQKANGTILEETQTSIAAIQKQVDAIDLKMTAKLTDSSQEVKSITDTFVVGYDAKRGEPNIRTTTPRTTCVAFHRPARIVAIEAPCECPVKVRYVSPVAAAAPA